jgi:membrane fusion protein (multidrug efflux system)
MSCRALLLVAMLLLSAAPPAAAQFGGGPPAVGVTEAKLLPIVETSEFVGRVQAIEKVDLIARVTAYLEEIHFTEGTEVQRGDLLYVLERGPFEADVAAKQATVAQIQALLRNATLTLNRAQALLNTPAGQRSAVDDAQAQQASQAAQLLAAQAQLRASQINLAYTEIRAPIAGRISRTNVTVGNVVGPSSGVLATIYSQDPIYVLFPVSVRAGLELRKQHSGQGALEAVKVKLRLEDGSMFSEIGHLDYVDPSVATNTDTLMLRARIANPLPPGRKPTDRGDRMLVDGEFVTVILEGAEPVMALGIPRSAILTDQQGNYVYVVDAEKHAQQRRVTLGQSSAGTAVILTGLHEGEEVITEGLQRVRPGAAVNPGPPAAAATAKPPEPARAKN